MAYSSKNPRSSTLLLTDQVAAGVSNAPTGTARLLNRNGVIYVQNTSGVEQAIGLTSPTRFLAYRTATQSIPNAAETKVQFNVESFDTNGEYDAATNYRFTVTRAGKYMLGAIVDLSLQDSGLQIQILMKKNGTTYIAKQDLRPGATAAVTTQVTTIASLIVSDYVEVFVYQSSGPRNTGDSLAACQFWGYELI